MIRLRSARSLILPGKPSRSMFHSHSCTSLQPQHLSDHLHLAHLEAVAGIADVISLPTPVTSLAEERSGRHLHHHKYSDVKNFEVKRTFGGSKE